MQVVPSTHARVARRRMRARGAVLAIALGAAVVASSLPAHGAAGSVNVTLAVTSATSIVPTACASGTAGATDFGTVQPGTSIVASADCTITFGSTNDTSMLRLSQQDFDGVGMFQGSRGALSSWSGDGKDTEAFAEGTEGAQAFVDSQGRVLVVHPYSDFGGYGAIRYDAAGTPDGTYDGDGRSQKAMFAGSYNYMFGGTIQPDDKVIGVGSARPCGCPTRKMAVARWATNGLRDVGFDGDGMQTFDLAGSDEIAIDAAVEPSGTILLVGHANWSAATSDWAIARIKGDGSALDPTFNASTGKLVVSLSAGKDRLTAVAVQSDGKVLVAGTFSDGTNYDVAVRRYDALGNPDATWAGGQYTIDANLPNEGWVDLKLQGDGKVLLSAPVRVGAENDFTLRRLSTLGAPDPTFGSGGIYTNSFRAGDDSAGSIELQPDGKVVAAISDATQFGIARLTSTGVLDTSLEQDGILYTDVVGASNDSTSDVAIAPDGDIVQAGTTWGAQYDVAITRHDGVSISTYSGSADWGTVGTNHFGACLRSIAGGATLDVSTWTADTVDADCADGVGDPWKPVVATGATVGSKVAMSGAVGNTSAVANLRFGVRTKTDQAPGAYVAPVTFEVIAPNA